MLFCYNLQKVVPLISMCYWFRKHDHDDCGRAQPLFERNSSLFVSNEQDKTNMYFVFGGIYELRIEEKKYEYEEVVHRGLCCAVSVCCVLCHSFLCIFRPNATVSRISVMVYVSSIDSFCKATLSADTYIT